MTKALHPLDVLPKRKIRRYGWKPSLPDQRDLLYSASHTTLATLPDHVAALDAQVPVYDQLALGSCSANAIAGAIDVLACKEGRSCITPSRLFIYYNERVIEGTVGEDSGAFLRDGVKSVNKVGVPPESYWPYDSTVFTTQPSDQAYTEALRYQISSYRRVQQNLLQLQACLASGFPFILGITVYDSFESAEVARTGVVPLPAAQEQMVGGHAILAVGYDNASQRFWCRNSWGTSWGMDGRFTIPYAYVLSPQLAADFWVLQVLEPLT